MKRWFGATGTKQLTTRFAKQQQHHWFGYQQQQQRNISGFAFDIDGVLLRGHKPIPKSREALIELKKNKIPFLCLTNGGGFLESVKAEYVNNVLKLPDEFKLTPEQMIQSHTPFQEFAKDYEDKKVLIVGGYDCLNVAKSYGFKNAVHVDEYHRKYPFLYSIFPPRDITKEEYKRMKQMYSFEIDPTDRMSAVLWMYESDHLGRDLQIVLDFVLSKHGLPGHLQDYNFKNFEQTCKLVMSNQDFLYSSSFSWPRFGQGMIKLCLQSIFKELTGKDLQIQQYGKPMKVTYDFCKKRLNELAAKNGITESVDRIFMVGDNPLSDILGAHNAGDPWQSVLVKTGLYRGDLDHQKPAHFVVADAFTFVTQHLQY
ncbi:hypothetical protein FDP41_005833 [Naegleria fowleri]|uniref:Uncharacterized protein n=1 Tax=Naegleria fowleri TaxID=5763 RepID=A0A6A5BM51_NAEFO|nr:uncharacterized protein FDP41_005833 [Naegleria fowleri]KAF0975080.1 hypothetical protein FDP41_005833 [Naegleria fowleri]